MIFLEVLIILPIAYLVNFKNFSYLGIVLSFLAVSIAGYQIISLFFTKTYYDKENRYSSIEFLKKFIDSSEAWSLKEVFKLYGICSFAISNFLLLFPLRSTMKHPKKFKSQISKVYIFYCLLLLTVSYASQFVTFYLN